MERGTITLIEPAAIGLGTIEPEAPPGPVSFSIAVVEGRWDQLFVGRPVTFERPAGGTIASLVRPA